MELKQVKDRGPLRLPGVEPFDPMDVHGFCGQSKQGMAALSPPDSVSTLLPTSQPAAPGSPHDNYTWLGSTSGRRIC